MTYTLQQIEALHKKYAPSDTMYDLVFTHCKIVCDIAMQLIEKQALKVDADLVRTGSLLHDIGVYSLVGADGKLLPGVSYLTHGIEGEKILKQEGFPEAIWRFASHHTGTGISKQDVIENNLPLPAADYFADSIEEQLVMYADKFHSKYMPHFNSFASCEQKASKFGTDKLQKFEHMAEMFGQPDLEPLAQKYNHDIR